MQLKTLNPTNQLTYTGDPIPIRQVTLSPGTSVYTQRLFPATARLSGGEISNVTLVRGDKHVNYSRATSILLSVGDTRKVESTNPPTLTIVPFKSR